MSLDRVRARVGLVVAAVLEQAVRNAGAEGIVLLDDGSPEATLAVDWCAAAAGANRVWRVAAPDADAARGLAAAAAAGRAGDDPDDRRLIEEAQRFAARLDAHSRRALIAHPANKTALVLGAVPPEPLLPLGDLWASQVEALAGGWSGPPIVHRLADAAGGIGRLDAVLAALLDRERADAGAPGVPDDAAAEIARAFAAGRFRRRRAGLVPKLGPWTLGIDLFG